MQVSCIDISRAYLHAQVKNENPLYVHLPSEDPDYGKGFCGKLNVHLYGTLYNAVVPIYLVPVMPFNARVSSTYLVLLVLLVPQVP